MFLFLQIRTTFLLIPYLEVTFGAMECNANLASAFSQQKGVLEPKEGCVLGQAKNFRRFFTSNLNS